MKRKKILSCFLTLVLIILMPTKLFAGTYYIDGGDITITNNGTQQVTQNSTTKDDNDITITQHNPETANEHKIVVNTTDNNVAEFTIKDINIKASDTPDDNIADGDGIDVDDSNAKITLEGNNRIDVSNSNAESGIHVTSGSVTITSSETETGKGTLTVVSSDGNDNASIGSHKNEAMSGTIHITGNASIDVNGGDGAAIGSGYESNLSGKIVVDGNSKVNATSNNSGAAIGSGEDGDVTDKGKIIIKGDAEVTATSKNNGAAIGSGFRANLDGDIVIGGNANVNAVSDTNSYGAAIGSGSSWYTTNGYDGTLSGNIVIEDDASVVARSNSQGAAIGSGKNSNITDKGNIVIKDNADVVAFSDGTGSGIGSGAGANLGGSIEITDSAKVIAVGNLRSAGIGTGEFGSIKDSGSITISENADASAYGDGDSINSAAAIGTSVSGDMEGIITISGNSKVKAIKSTYAAAIGTGNYEGYNQEIKTGEMSGAIKILDYAKVTTGTKTDAKVTLTKNIDGTYTINYKKSDGKGIIGRGYKIDRALESGAFIIGTGVTINGIKGSNEENLEDYINYHVNSDYMSNLIIVESEPLEDKEDKIQEQIETIIHKKVVNTSVKNKPTVKDVIDDEPMKTNIMNIWSLPLFIVLFACLILLRRKRLNS